MHLLVWGYPETTPGADARLIAEVEGLDAEGRAEMRTIERRLRRAAAETGGLPIAPDWDDGLSGEHADVLRPLVETVAGMRDPEALIGSPDLTQLLAIWYYAFGDFDDLVEPSRFPVDDLERWFGLAGQDGTGYVAVYLMPL